MRLLGMTDEERLAIEQATGIKTDGIKALLEAASKQAQEQTQQLVGSSIKEIQGVILKNPTNPEIYKIARQKGMLTMKEDAMLKSLEGKVPLTEVYNFTSENE